METTARSKRNMGVAGHGKPVTGEFLYDRVERQICELITRGELRPGDPLYAPEKLLALFGATSGTLRHALQNLAARGVVVRRPKAGTFINPSLDISRLLNASDGSQAENSASAAPADKSDARSMTANAIGMVVPDLQMFEFATVARGVEAAVEHAGLNLIIGNSDDNPERLDRIIRQQLRAGVGGLIIATGKHLSLGFETIREIQAAEIPVVNCYRSIGLVEWPVIRAAGATNIHELALHLCDVGRKNIAYFDFNVKDVPEVMLKREGRWGFMSALISRGVVPRHEYYLEYPRDVQPYGESHYVIDRSEIRMVVEWFKAHKEVDAVLCVHDRLAAIVVAACREMKKVIPRDIAIGGGGLSGERFGFRKGWLTSIDVRFAELGKRACDLIFRQRQGETIPPATMLLVDGALCLGESTTGLL